jgi:type IV pilus assembly protein PilC
MPTVQTLSAINFDEPEAPQAEALPRHGIATTVDGMRLGGPRLKRGELVQVCAQLSVMLETGVTVSDALDCIARQADRPQVKQVLEEVAASVGRGEDFSTALGRQPGSFPQILVALVRASEKGGMLSRMIERANGYLRDEQEIIRKVRGALIYPGIMFSFALLTCVFMLAFIMPRFTVLYRGKEHLLPAPTKALLWMSGLITSHWPYLLIGTAVALFFGWQWTRSEGGRQIVHRLQLRLPLVGAMYRKLHLSRGLRMIGTLAGAGVGLVDCVENAEQLAGNREYARLWNGMGSRISQGMPFSEALRMSALVPPSVAQMLHSGETAGKLASVTERVAEHAETELKEAITEVTRYIEPLMIVVMGALIGGMTLAMLLPVFTVSRVMVQ